MPGSYDFGEDGFGDELPEIAASVATSEPASMFFDPQTRRHQISSEGKYIFIHAVDAEVIHCLHFAKEKLLSSKETGALYWKLPSPYHPQALAMVEDWTRLALANPLANGVIELGVIEFETSLNNAYISKISVAYKNLKLWPFDTQTTSVGF